MRLPFQPDEIEPETKFSFQRKQLSAANETGINEVETVLTLARRHFPASKRIVTVTKNIMIVGNGEVRDGNAAIVDTADVVTRSPPRDYG